MKIELSDELEISQQISNSSQIRSNSYIYNQMLKINNGNKLLTFQQIMVNQNNNSQNSQISELTFRSLSMEIDNKLMQEFQSNRHMIIPHQMPYSLQSPFSSINKQRCSICFSEIQDIIKIEECNHQFCQKCVTLYLYNKIICGEIQKIPCPQDGCKTILNEIVIKQNIDNEVYLKYQRFQLIKQYEHITNGKWCPRPDCFNFIYKQGNSKILQCKCGQQFCFDCGNVLHPNKSCEDNIDQVFAQAIKDHKIQKCPKCKANIIKNGGCNHMTCYKCSYNFCWLCGSKYNSIHYDWMNPFNCPGDQYSERDPYQFPKILICIRAIFKIFIYLLLSPLIAIGGIGMLLYGLGYILIKICKLCGICLPCICCCC